MHSMAHQKGSLQKAVTQIWMKSCKNPPPFDVLHPRIQKADPRPPTPPCVLASLAYHPVYWPHQPWDSQGGIRVLAMATHTETNAYKKRTQSLLTLVMHDMWLFMSVSSHSDHSRCRDIHTRGITFILITGKNQNNPNLSPMLVK